MLDDARSSLRKEIDRLQRAVAQKSKELASLNEALKRCKGALELLGNGARGGTARAKKKRRKAGTGNLVNWNSVFARLPTLTLKEFTGRPESKGKSPVYLRQIAARWVKQGKTKRVGLGKYQKAGRRKPVPPDCVQGSQSRHIRNLSGGLSA